MILLPIVCGVVILIVTIGGVVAARKGMCCQCFIRTFPKLFKDKKPADENQNNNNSNMEFTDIMNEKG